LPWATDEAARPDAQRARLEEVVPHWDDGTEYSYLVTEGPLVIGGMGLHARIGPGALELGYWLRSGFGGRGIATRCAQVLTGAAMELEGVDRLEIHCDESNVRSAAIPRRLGYRLARVDTVPVASPSESGRSMIWIYPPDTVSA